MCVLSDVISPPKDIIPFHFIKQQDERQIADSTELKTRRRSLSDELDQASLNLLLVDMFLLTTNDTDEYFQ